MPYLAHTPNSSQMVRCLSKMLLMWPVEDSTRLLIFALVLGEDWSCNLEGSLPNKTRKKHTGMITKTSLLIIATLSNHN